MSSVVIHNKMIGCVCSGCGKARVIWRSSSRKKGFTGLCPRGCGYPTITLAGRVAEPLEGVGIFGYT